MAIRERWTLEGMRCTECGSMARDASVPCPRGCNAPRRRESVEVVPAPAEGAVDPMQTVRLARARGLAQAIAECRDDARLDAIREGAVEIVSLLPDPERGAVSAEERIANLKDDRDYWHRQADAMAAEATRWKHLAERFSAQADQLQRHLAEDLADPPPLDEGPLAHLHRRQVDAERAASRENERRTD